MNISYSKSSDLFNSISQNGNSYISSYRKSVREADTNVQDLQEDVANFRKCVRNLKNYDSDTITRSKLEKYMDKFAETYNELAKSSKNITDKELSETLTKLEDFMEENKKSLKKLGLRESNGKWSFDSEALEEVKDSEIDAMFEGKDAIFKQMDKLMRKVEKKADEEEYQMVMRSFHSITEYSAEEMEQAFAVCTFPATIEYAQENNSIVQSYDSSSGDDISENVANVLKGFCADYNYTVGSVIDKTKAYVGFMSDKTKEYETHLNNIGISIVDGKLSCDTNVAVDDAYKDSYKALFGEDASYGILMKTYAKNIFNLTLNTESLGITINSYA